MAKSNSKANEKDKPAKPAAPKAEKPETGNKDKSGVALRETTDASSGKKSSVKGLKIGGIVSYKPAATDNTVNGNTEEPAPAIITKVFDADTVNLTVFRDGPTTNKAGVKKDGTKKDGDTTSDAGVWSEIE